MAPAFSIRSAYVQKKSTTRFFRALTPPKVLTQPGLKSNKSFIAVGTPWRGPKAAPAISACSASLARLRASSNPRYTKAFRLVLRCSIRSMNASTTSTGESWWRRMRIASSVAVTYASSSDRAISRSFLIDLEVEVMQKFLTHNDILAHYMMPKRAVPNSYNAGSRPPDEISSLTQRARSWFSPLPISDPSVHLHIATQTEVWPALYLDALPIS